MGFNEPQPSTSRDLQGPKVPSEPKKKTNRISLLQFNEKLWTQAYDTSIHDSDRFQHNCSVSS